MSMEERLISLRKGRGMSQLEDAEALGVSRQAVSKWEPGAAVPSIDNLRAISRLYEVTIDHLVGDEDESPIQSSGPDASSEPDIPHEPNVPKGSLKYFSLTISSARTGVPPTSGNFTWTGACPRKARARTPEESREAFSTAASASGTAPIPPSGHPGTFSSQKPLLPFEKEV